jgi:hypothetical protein
MLPRTYRPMVSRATNEQRGAAWIAERHARGGGASATRRASRDAQVRRPRICGAALLVGVATDRPTYALSE